MASAMLDRGSDQKATATATVTHAQRISSHRSEARRGAARRGTERCVVLRRGGVGGLTVRRCLCSRTTAWLENEAVFGRGCNNAPVSMAERGVKRERERGRGRGRGRGERAQHGNLQHYSVSVIAALRPSISSPARSAAPYSDYPCCPSSCSCSCSSPCACLADWPCGCPWPLLGNRIESH